MVLNQTQNVHCIECANFPVSAELVIASKTDVGFIFDLFSTKTLIGTDYIPYHLNVISFFLRGCWGFFVCVFFVCFGFGCLFFTHIHTGPVLFVLSYFPF